MTKSKKKNQKSKKKTKKQQQSKKAVAFDIENQPNEEKANQNKEKEKEQQKSESTGEEKNEKVPEKKSLEQKKKNQKDSSKEKDKKEAIKDVEEKSSDKKGKEITKKETKEEKVSKEKENKKPERVPYLAYIRAISSVAIVLLHTAFAFAGTEGLSESLVKVSLVIRNCCLWAVPLFVMVTGALLLDPNRDIQIKDIFHKYIKRILILIFVFTLLNEAFDVFLLGKKYDNPFAFEYLIKVFTDQSWPHMWYLYMLVGIYLLLPIYRAAAKNMGKKEFQYLLIVYFIFLSVRPLIYGLFGVQSAFYITTTTIYPFYLFAGYAIHNDYINVSKQYAIAGSIIGLVGVILATLYLPQLSTISYAFPCVVLQAICLFALFKQSTVLNKADKVLMQMDSVSLGVYLLHLMPIKLFFNVLGWNKSIFMIIPVACISYIISYGVTYAYKKIG